jgi:hypothetical protein
MLGGYRLAVLALGLILCRSAALAEHPGLPEFRAAEQTEPIQEAERDAHARPSPEVSSSADDYQAAGDHREAFGDQPARGADDYAFWDASTAQWIMAGTSVLSAVIAGLAVMLVYCTLREARRTTRAALRSNVQARRAVAEAKETNRIAVNVGFTETRPWLAINNLELTWWTISVGARDPNHSHALWINGRYDVVNSGQTPALHASNWHIAAADSLTATDPRIAEMIDGLHQNTISEKGRAIPPNASLSEEFTARVDFLGPRPDESSCGVILNISICVTYRSAESEQYMETAQGFCVLQRQQPGVATPMLLDFADLLAKRPIDFIYQRVGISRMT